MPPGGAHGHITGCALFLLHLVPAVLSRWSQAEILSLPS